MGNTAIDLSLATAEVDFAVGNLASWDAFQLPIPKDTLVITTDTLEFRVGTGSLLFGQLSNSATIAAIQAGKTTVSTELAALTTDEDDRLIINTGTTFDVGNTTLDSISARLVAITNDDALQNANVDAIQSQNTAANPGITTSNNGELVVIGNQQMTPGVSPISLVANVLISQLIIMNVVAYSDLECTIPVTRFVPGALYFIKIFASDDTVGTSQLTFGLTSDQSSTISITPSGVGVFAIAVSETASSESIIFTASVSYGSTTVSSALTVNVNGA